MNKDEQARLVKEIKAGHYKECKEFKYLIDQKHVIYIDDGEYAFFCNLHHPPEFRTYITHCPRCGKKL